MHPVRRLGLLGDIHGAIDRLDHALAVFERSGVDGVASVGDVVDGPLGPETDVGACIDRLWAIGARCVRGNHDRWLTEGVLRGFPGWTTVADLTEDQREFVRWLPSIVRIQTTRGEALLCHGLAEDDMTSFEPTLGPCDTEQAEILDQLAASNLRFVMCGHTHRRAVARYGELVVVNAGALTECDRPGFAIVDFDHGHVEFFEFGATASTCAEVAHRMSFCRGS